MKRLVFAVPMLGLFAAAMPAAAVEVVPTSYSMLNGDGNAHNGTFNYWDLAYDGAGATNVDGAALSGGSGDLTDGVVASGIWSSVENGAGTGPYVGWTSVGVIDPLVTFFFAGSPTITSIAIHMDNSNFGGVYAPTAILLDGTPVTFTPPADGTIGFATISGLALTGGSHTLQFLTQRGPDGQTWVFLSEVDFFAVPEPATWAMMIGGIGLTGGMARRRRTAPALA
jgi:hypothetical protein